MVAVHIVVSLTPAAYTILGIADSVPRAENPIPPILLSLLLGALVLRQSLAIAGGHEPHDRMWIFLIVAVLVYLPMFWFGYFNWAFAAVMLVALAPTVVRGRAGFVLAGSIALLSGILAWIEGERLSPPPSDLMILQLVITWTLILAGLGAFLFGSAHLVRMLAELRATRSELAELAVGRERLRISRDLHDLLGQSLSAISLKGDLAIKLLHSDTTAAHGEIESLTAVAREAMRGVRAIASEQHGVTLGAEVDGAAALLSAAGIRTTVNANVAGLPAPLEQALAWAVREGVANILLHSAATSCSIVAEREGTSVRLEIVNDGARPQMREGDGHGLAGLSARVQALSGAVSAAQNDRGQFTLLIRIPEEGQPT
jgi:two-component system sensor histidine kinase DesK